MMSLGRRRRIEDDCRRIGSFLMLHDRDARAVRPDSELFCRRCPEGVACGQHDRFALLLAFLAYHPAPFVLFDEVDAALDEANVIRMARYMKNYSGTTQFIVITHRRKTMEAANTLQGVTMEEKGVSRLLTVKVDDMIEKGS